MNYYYPWYDSNWLTDYACVKDYIKQRHPEKYAEFLDTFAPLRTRHGFQVIKLDNIFDQRTLEEARSLIQNLKSQEREKHEFFSFGRLVVHDHPFFNELQESLTDLVSEAVKEQVEAYYNFLSLYTDFGFCQVHMDAPEAKWTLDCCIEQSEPWPIHFSQVQPWPETFQGQEENWQKQIIEDPDNVFSTYSLKEREAIIFSGSSQWHYRNRIPQTSKKNFCHLVFFHYIPKGTREIIDPQNWSELFNLPDLKSLELCSASNN